MRVRSPVGRCATRIGAYGSMRGNALRGCPFGWYGFVGRVRLALRLGPLLGSRRLLVDLVFVVNDFDRLGHDRGGEGDSRIDDGARTGAKRVVVGSFRRHECAP